MAEKPTDDGTGEKTGASVAFLTTPLNRPSREAQGNARAVSGASHEMERTSDTDNLASAARQAFQNMLTRVSTDFSRREKEKAGEESAAPTDSPQISRLRQAQAHWVETQNANNEARENAAASALSEASLTKGDAIADALWKAIAPPTPTNADFAETSSILAYQEQAKATFLTQLGAQNNALAKILDDFFIEHNINDESERSALLREEATRIIRHLLPPLLASRFVQHTTHTKESVTLLESANQVAKNLATHIMETAIEQTIKQALPALGLPNDQPTHVR